jgi:hypothetical protein
MTDEQSLRLTALKVAVLTFGQKELSFDDPYGDRLKIPDELRSRAEIIEQYVLEYGADWYIKSLHPLK